MITQLSTWMNTCRGVNVVHVTSSKKMGGCDVGETIDFGGAKACAMWELKQVMTRVGQAVAVGVDPTRLLRISVIMGVRIERNCPVTRLFMR